MEEFVQLAILLSKANVLEIIDDRYSEYETYTGSDIIVKLNNQEYVVSNISSQNKEKIVDRKYNKAFLKSVNNSDRPRIDKVQNGELLFDAAYKLLRFLPAKCREEASACERTDVQIAIADIIASQCGEWLTEANPLHITIDQENESYEEAFDCRTKYTQSSGNKGSVQLLFRYQRPVLRTGLEPKMNTNEITTAPIIVDIAKSEKNLPDVAFEEWAMDHTSQEDTRDLKESYKVIERHVNDMVSSAVNDHGYIEYVKGVSDVSAVSVESVKYRRVYKYAAALEAKVKPDKSNLLAVKSNFDSDALFVYEPAVIPSVKSVNIFKCPTPSCGKFMSASNTMQLLVDPNWRKPHTPLTDINDAKVKQWYRHAVGCKVCMSEECAFCGQRYFPFGKINELNAFYEYSASPKKAFLIDSDEKADAGVIARLHSGQDKVADYCACMEGIYWYYDEAFQKESGESEQYDRVLRNRDMVFVNRRTKEVVAAYSPASYQSALQGIGQLFLTNEEGETEDQTNLNKMVSGRIKVFFSEFVLDRMNKRKGSLATFKEYVEDREDLKEQGLCFLDKLDAAMLGQCCEAAKMDAKKKEEFLADLKKDLADLIDAFKTNLSKYSSMDGKSKDLIWMTSVNSCSLCKVCGGLYFVKDEANDTILALPNKHGTDDVCAPDRKGRWTSMRGSIFYKDTKDHSTHISNRFVLTRRGEVTFDDWQTRICKDMGIRVVKL